MAKKTIYKRRNTNSTNRGDIFPINNKEMYLFYLVNQSLAPTKIIIIKTFAYKF